MGRKKSNSDIVLPAAGAVGFSLPIIPITSIDNTLNRNGFSRDLRINPRAIGALERFTDLTASRVLHPDMFFPEYVERARSALNKRVFSNGSSTTIGQGLNNSEFTRLVHNINKDKKAFKGLGFIGNTLKSLIGGVETNGAQYSASEAVGNGLGKALASHMLGVSGDFNRAYRRLLSEVAGFSTVQGKTPEFAAIRNSTKNMAEDLYEAVVNHTAPTRGTFSGKSFASPSAYIDELWNNTKNIGGMSSYRGVYSQATDIASKIIQSSASKEEAIKKLTDLLGGEKGFYGTSLLQRIGTPDRYGIEETPFGKVLKVIKSGKRGTNSATSKAKALNNAANNLATSIMHGDASRLFLGATKYHRPHLTNIKMLNVLQKIRSPYLRAALGIRSVGSAGLLIKNIYDRAKKKSILDKLRDLINV